MRRRAVTLLLLACLTACQTVPKASGFSARQIAVLTENGFVQSDEGWALGLADRLLFATDESVLAGDQRKRLNRTAGMLANVGITRARVEGHTDATGRRSYNQQLSKRRAGAVRTALIEGGMNAAAIEAIGLGATRPIESNRSTAGRQENRRVVIIVTPDGSL